MTSLAIRDARPEDLEVIASFNIALAAETEECHLDSATVHRGVTAVLENPNLGNYFIAEVEGEIAGQLMITQEWSDWRCGFFHWIQSVYVRPEFRGCSVFRSLYDHVIARAKASDEVCGVRLYVDNENTGAREVYDRVGMLSGGYDLREIDWGRPRD